MQEASCQQPIDLTLLDKRPHSSTEVNQGACLDFEDLMVLLADALT
jgi:hypothetical protein